MNIAIAGEEQRGPVMLGRQEQGTSVASQQPAALSLYICMCSFCEHNFFLLRLICCRVILKVLASAKTFKKNVLPKSHYVKSRILKTLNLLTLNRTETDGKGGEIKNKI